MAPKGQQIACVETSTNISSRMPVNIGLVDMGPNPEPSGQFWIQPRTDIVLTDAIEIYVIVFFK